MTTIRDVSTIRLGVIMAVAVGLAAVIGAVAVPGVTAQEGDTELANETVSVDASTQSVYAEVNATDAGSEVTATATWYGVDGGGIGTQEAQTSGETVASGETSLLEESPDPSTYDTYRVVVTESSSTEGATADVGTIQKVSGGGGGLPGGTVAGGVPVIAIVAVAGGYYYMQED